MIAYANHNHFYDGHLMWLAARLLFDREVIIWMRELKRFPFFRAEGALPFPTDDAARRASTIRSTATRFGAPSPPVLGYFPNGELTPPESGVGSFNLKSLKRLDNILSGSIWMPLGIHVTWWGEDRPTALLGSGSPAEFVQGDEADRLQQVLARLKRYPQPPHHVLVEGTRSRHEKWDFTFARHLYS